MAISSQSFESKPNFNVFENSPEDVFEEWKEIKKWLKIYFDNFNTNNQEYIKHLITSLSQRSYKLI